MTNSAFVLDWSRPVPLSEFFLPLTEVRLYPQYRFCHTHAVPRSANNNRRAGVALIRVLPLSLGTYVIPW